MELASIIIYRFEMRNLNCCGIVCKHWTTATRLCPFKNIAKSMIVDVLIYLFFRQVFSHVFSITLRFTITASSHRIFILYSLHHFFSLSSWFNCVCSLPYTHTQNILLVVFFVLSRSHFVFACTVCAFLFYFILFIVIIILVGSAGCSWCGIGRTM